jgi:L-lactate dehydrogenase complex protein LldG
MVGKTAGQEKRRRNVRAPSKPLDIGETRALILRKISGANKATVAPGDLAAEYDSIPRDYLRAGVLTLAERLEMMEHRLREYDASVYRSTSHALPEEIAKVLAGRGKSRIAIPAGFPAAWLPEGFSFVEADGLSAPQLDRLDGLLSACTVAIAATGTLVLQTAPAQGARKLSLVPDYHLCVVEAAQVVETVPEAFSVLAPANRLATTFISGPSATADIEMTRIKGVHGPRFLDVIMIVAGSSSAS